MACIFQILLLLKALTSYLRGEADRESLQGVYGFSSLILNISRYITWRSSSPTNLSGPAARSVCQSVWALQTAQCRREQGHAYLQFCIIDDNPLHFQQAILLKLEPSKDVKRLQMFNNRIPSL